MKEISAVIRGIVAGLAVVVIALPAVISYGEHKRDEASFLSPFEAGQILDNPAEEVAHTHEERMRRAECIRFQVNSDLPAFVCFGDTES